MHQRGKSNFCLFFAREIWPECIWNEVKKKKKKWNKIQRISHRANSIFNIFQRNKGKKTNGEHNAGPQFCSVFSFFVWTFKQMRMQLAEFLLFNSGTCVKQASPQHARITPLCSEAPLTQLWQLAVVRCNWLVVVLQWLWCSQVSGGFIHLSDPRHGRICPSFSSVVASLWTILRVTSSRLFFICSFIFFVAMCWLAIGELFLSQKMLAVPGRWARAARQSVQPVLRIHSHRTKNVFLRVRLAKASEPHQLNLRATEEVPYDDDTRLFSRKNWSKHEQKFLSGWLSKSASGPSCSISLC